MFRSGNSDNDTADDDPDAYERWQKRKQQFCFIGKVYGISVCLVTLALTQWTLTTASYTISYWLQRHRYINLPLTLLGFVALLVYAFFHKRLFSASRCLHVVVAVLTLEVNTGILIRPMVSCTRTDVIYSAIAVAVALALGLIIACIKHSLRTRETAFYITWTLRLFVVTELGFCTAYAMRSAYVDMTFTCVMLLPYVVLFLYFNISLGSTEFAEKTTADYITFSTLYCCNVLGMYSNVLLFVAVFRARN